MTPEQFELLRQWMFASTFALIGVIVITGLLIWGELIQIKRLLEKWGDK